MRFSAIDTLSHFERRSFDYAYADIGYFFAITPPFQPPLQIDSFIFRLSPVSILDYASRLPPPLYCHAG